MDEETNEVLTNNVESAVESIADQIMVDLGQAEAPKEKPAESESERIPQEETKTEPTGNRREDQTAPDQEVKKEKIKWHGQEVEMSLDEIKNFAQQGYDYTKKTQELSDLRASLAPLEGLKRNIESDPAFAAHIAAYFKGKQETPKQPTFDDPIEQLKYETRQEVLREVEEKFVKPIQQQNRQMTHQQVIAATRAQVQADPDFANVQKAITDYVQSLPPSIQKTTYLQLDQDPKAYLEMFQHFKERLSASKQQTKVETPKASTKTEHAPILEQAGAIAERSTESDKAKKLSRMKQKALSSGDPIAMADWLEQAGAFDHLYK